MYPFARFELTSNGRVPTNLLRLNRQINREATAELYRRLKVSMANLTPAQLQCLRYWFRTKHPIRLTRSLTIHNEVSHYHERQLIGDLTKEDLRYYSGLFNSMPNLHQVTVAFEDWGSLSGRWNTRPIFLNSTGRFVNNLKYLRDNIRRQVRLVLDFDTGDAWKYIYWEGEETKSSKEEMISCLQRLGFTLSNLNGPIIDSPNRFQMVRKF